MTRLAGPDSGSAGLGPFLGEHAAEIARELELPEEIVAAAAVSEDELLYPSLVLALRQWQAKRSDRRQEDMAATAESAARTLGSSAVWHDDCVVLRVGLLFGDVLANTQTKYIRFVADEIDVAIYRRTLVDTARAVARFRDLGCFVDSSGLHVRWRSGRGQLNYIPQRVLPYEQDLALLVPLARPIELEEVVFVPTPPLRRVSRPTLIGDILADIGFG